MNNEKFNEIVTHRLKACEEILVKKSDEYSSDTDRLHNFKHAALMQRITPVEALRGMWTKHLVSIMDICGMLAEGEIPSKEMLAEKLGDNINYSLLLEALAEEIREEYKLGGTLKQLAEMGEARKTVTAENF